MLKAPSDGSPWEQQRRFCIIYRLERKKILQSHMHLCNVLGKFLSSEHKSKADYLTLSSYEETERDRSKYFVRRLNFRHYLKECVQFFENF
jgi:hypothetical protein